jgi:hypothetical protein
VSTSLRRTGSLSALISILLTIVQPLSAHAAGTISFAPFASISGSPTLIDAGRPEADFDKDGFADTYDMYGPVVFGGPNPGVQRVEGVPFVVGFGDFNGDGNTDLIASNHPLLPFGRPFVVLGLGAGTGADRAAFETAALTIEPGLENTEIRAYDVNLDGADDIVTWRTIGPPENADVHFGSSSGTPFAGPPLRVGADLQGFAGFLDVQSADLNNDGFGDMVILNGNFESWYAAVYEGGPNGFTLVTTIPLALFSWMSLGDVNGDGLIDVGSGNAPTLWALQVPSLPANVPETPLPALGLVCTTALLASASVARRRRLLRL